MCVCRGLRQLARQCCDDDHHHHHNNNSRGCLETRGVFVLLLSNLHTHLGTQSCTQHNKHPQQTPHTHQHKQHNTNTNTALASTTTCLVCVVGAGEQAVLSPHSLSYPTSLLHTQHEKQNCLPSLVVAAVWLLPSLAPAAAVAHGMDTQWHAWLARTAPAGADGQQPGAFLRVHTCVMSRAQRHANERRSRGNNTIELPTQQKGPFCTRPEQRAKHRQMNAPETDVHREKIIIP